jgi:hypothetical protein
MLFIFQLGLIGTVMAVFYLTSLLLILTRSLKAASDTVNSGNDDDQAENYDIYESTIAKKFNEFYFSSITTCTDSKYAFFWGFVDDHCPVEMSVQNCVKCYDYSISSCPADETTCFSDSPYSSQACPYNICRGPILDYLIAYSE